tara:strand:+ start:1081 stop:1359 length:279 start_codon:yes stop_codon:yes gene_type:complete
MNNKYRFVTGTLLKYEEEEECYVACFTDSRANTMASAIEAYESEQNKIYSVWVGGVEVTYGPVGYQRAIDILEQYFAEGHTDVGIQKLEEQA